MLTVKLYTVRTRHGGFDCHCTLEYDERPVARKDQRIAFLSCGFDCICGEPLHDGDEGRWLTGGGFAHTNCVELIEPARARARPLPLPACFTGLQNVKRSSIDPA